MVSADWGDKGLVWTLTSPNRETRKAHATLAADCAIDNIIVASEMGSLGAGTSSPTSRSNQPAQLRVTGDQSRRAALNEPLQITARIDDDRLPLPGRVAALSAVRYSNEEEWLRADMRTTVSKMNGLFWSWNKYRGPSEATFNPPPSKSLGRYAHFCLLAVGPTLSASRCA